MPLVSALLRSEIGDAVLDPTAASREIHIALRRDGEVGSGSVHDPFDGSTAARFDAVMAALGDNVAVRLGPGTFPTQGERGWTVKNELRVIGSGMFVTILKLTLASATANSQYHVVGGSQIQNFKNGFELSDLTIDCNLAGQPDTGAGFPQIMAGGVDLRGPNMVIRRVRVINFGTNTKSWECFGIGIAYAEASDTPVASNCVIEDCVIERPALSNARETTCLNLSAYEDALLRAAYHEDCAIRNCYINCEYVRSSDAKPALKVSSLTSSGTTATLTTIEPHGRVLGDWILVSGATDPSSGDFYARIGQTALFNGSFKVTHVSDGGLSLNYTMDDPPASLSAGGEVWLGKAPSAVRNCSGSGPCLSDEVVPSGDLILRNNVFSKVQNGPTLALHSGTTVGRLLVQGNWIELGASGSVSGIRLSAASSGFTSVILRGNIIRYATAPGTIPTTDAGINLSGCASAIVENNIIDVGTPDHAILHDSTDGVHLFNNLTSGGVFRPGFDGTLHDQELTTEVEDVLRGILMR